MTDLAKQAYLQPGWVSQKESDVVADGYPTFLVSQGGTGFKNIDIEIE